MNKYRSSGDGLFVGAMIVAGLLSLTVIGFLGWVVYRLVEWVVTK